MDEIVQKIRNIRKENKLTQEEVANKLGITVRAYSKIENGETQLTLDRLRKLMDIFKQPFCSLFIDNSSNNINKLIDIENGEYISLLKHYEETIHLLKDHIRVLNTLLEKKLN